MSKILPWIIGIFAVILIITYVAPHVFDIMGWIIGRFVDVCAWLFGQIWSLLSVAFSIIWYLIKGVFSVLLELYTSLMKAYPIISIACFGVFFGAIYVFTRFFAFKINTVWAFILAPICASLVGNVLYGGGALKVDISVSDAGLIFLAILIMSGLYFALIKARILPPLENSKDAVSKMLNYSFIVVIILMVGGFGIAAIDKVVPFFTNHAA